MKKEKPEITPETVTRSLQTLIEKYSVQNKVTIDEIKRRIYEAGDENFQQNFRDYFEWAMGLFPNAATPDAKREVLQVCSDAWNVFPHKALDGKAPRDLMNDSQLPRMDRASENLIETFAESIKDLYAMARTRAQKEFRRIGGTPQEFSLLEEALGKTDSEENAMLRSLVSIGRRKGYTGTEWFEPFVREYQAMDNHQKLPHNEFLGSPYLFEVLRVAPEMKRNPAEVFGMIDYTLETHLTIAAVGKQFRLPLPMISIAHHAFDWLMRTRPADLMLDSPQTNALLLYALVVRIQKAVGTDDPAISETTFTEKIYPEERHLFTERVLELIPVLLTEVTDPHMLLVNAENAPDDWFARLKQLAPYMQDHFREEPQNGGIPSPFYP